MRYIPISPSGNEYSGPKYHSNLLTADREEPCHIDAVNELWKTKQKSDKTRKEDIRQHISLYLNSQQRTTKPKREKNLHRPHTLPGGDIFDICLFASSVFHTAIDCKNQWPLVSQIKSKGRKKNNPLNADPPSPPPQPSTSPTSSQHPTPLCLTEPQRSVLQISYRSE